ncbi:MAG TPA: DUF72 domain-containing protein [bacterium]|nr:DUF72 domain-containing protein [bacterium]
MSPHEAGTPPPSIAEIPGPGPRILAGTSGFAFAEWKGGFYPADLRQERMLGFYAEHLPSVEINVSFYRMPTSKMLEDWRGQTPASFRFAIKAHRRITHVKRLRDVDDDVRWLCERVTELGDRLGPVLFQLPPSFRQDLPLLESFLATLRPLPYVAIEFRHATWHADATYDLLRRHRVALCIAEDEASCEPLVHTASFGYYRLHRMQYTPVQLEGWAEHLRAAAELRPIFCYFTHETGPEAVAYARALMNLVSPGPP